MSKIEKATEIARTVMTATDDPEVLTLALAALISYHAQLTGQSTADTVLYLDGTIAASEMDADHEGSCTGGCV